MTRDSRASTRLASTWTRGNRRGASGRDARTVLAEKGTIMKRSEVQEWIDDLLSGEFPQGKGALNRSGTGFCCLGVKCERDARTRRHGIVRKSGVNGDVKYGIEGIPASSGTMPTDAILAAWGLSYDQARKLAGLNDGDLIAGTDPQPFPVIAEWIRKNILPDATDDDPTAAE